MDPIISKVSAAAIFKNASYILAAMIMPLGVESYTILAIFMVVDTVTGAIRSGVVHGPQSVTSRAAKVGIISKALMIIVPCLIAVAGRGIGMNLIVIAKSILKILILSELYSILSNIQSIRAGHDVKEFDAMNYVLSRIRDGLERFIKNEAK